MPKKPSKTLREWCIENHREDLLEEWDYEKNDELGITPQNIAYRSHKKVWWKCTEHNHSYLSSICDKTRDDDKCIKSCSVCAGKQIIYGENDLETYCKNNNMQILLEEWDTKNNKKLPREYSIHSNKKVNWICKKCGHCYSKSINDRTNGHGCGVCAGKVVKKGYNDLETYCKNNDMQYLLEEWNYELNNFLPDEKTPFANIKAHWICRFCGHKWEAYIPSRTDRSQNCPKCNLRSTSFPEQAIFYYIKQIYPDAENRFNYSGFEFDIFIPSINIAIEYDGVAFHTEKEQQDILKNKFCKNNNIALIRIQENGLKLFNDCLCIIREDKETKESLDKSIINLFKHLNIQIIDINTQRDSIAIMENYRLSKVSNSLAVKFPEIAKEWHPTKNGNLKPENFSYGSYTRVWWLCSECGHEWETSIRDRTRDNTKCNKCRPNKCKPIRCIETNLIYKSGVDAENRTGISRKCICNVVKGKQQTAGGYHWEYVDKENTQGKGEK